MPRKPVNVSEIEKESQRKIVEKYRHHGKDFITFEFTRLIYSSLSVYVP